MAHKTDLDVDLTTSTNSSKANSTTIVKLPPGISPFDLSTCDQFITTECLRALYNIPNGTLGKSSLAIVEYSPQSFLPADLGSYLAAVDPWIPAQTQPQVEFVDGAQLADITADSIESNLDLQLAVPLGK